MIPLLGAFFYDLLWSPERARLWLRSFLGVAFGAAAQAVAVPPEQVAAWTARDWAVRLGVALILGVALSVKAGDKNPAAPPHAEPPSP
jgi:hypothetical protein